MLINVHVRFFAGLRERFDLDALELRLPAGSTVRQAWSGAVKESIPDNVLAARNMEYTGLETELADGDEVAFFPPVTGGGGAG